jgi:uncharacterized membrane protein (DUF485 family)
LLQSDQSLNDAMPEHHQFGNGELLRSSAVSAKESAQHVAVAALIGIKLSFLVPMTIIYLVSYIGLTVLAGFAKGFLALKVVGAINLGFVLIAGNYVLAWLLAIIYVHVANTTFDPMIERAFPAVSHPRSSQ